MRTNYERYRRPVHILGLLVVLLGVLAFLVRGYHDERLALHFRDFKQPYASARCVLQHCDPYSEADTHAAFLSADGVDNDAIVWAPYSALYPPFSLVAFTSIAALPYPVAHAVWEALIASTFSIAVLLTWQMCVFVVSEVSGAVLEAWVVSSSLALFAATSTILLMLGQISGVVIALLTIGFACLVRNRLFALATCCFAVAVLLKPHLAAIPVLYLLFAGKPWRRAFATVFALSVLCVAGSLVWFHRLPSATSWPAELHANLIGNAAPGGANDPCGRFVGVNLTNLQALFGVFSSRRDVYNSASYAVTALLLAAWVIPVVRLRNSFGKHVLSIAAIACLSLLPVYHRQYDTRLLLLAFPAVVFLLAQQARRFWASLGYLLLAASTVLTSHTFSGEFLEPRQGVIDHASAARVLLLYRPIEDCVLLLAIYFIASLWLALRDQQRSQPHGVQWSNDVDRSSLASPVFACSDADRTAALVEAAHPLHP